ncbi:MAG: HU family DNA-binding protein [Deltaproteobacteria bacterium]|jgi:nucleoid DNA-binding protein|nr:HU family DNA-binding protein [Deltaproteobacteria bacterium]
MTKAELVARIAEEAQLTQAQANKALLCLIAAVSEEIQASRPINVTGLGTFSVSERSARHGINPRTREPIKIPSSKSVKFKCSKALKDALNAPPQHGKS